MKSTDTLYKSGLRLVAAGRRTTRGGVSVEIIRAARAVVVKSTKNTHPENRLSGGCGVRRLVEVVER